MKLPVRDISSLAPVIETDRLRLRGRTHEDFPSFVKLWGDPAVTKYITGEAMPEEDVWSKFLRMVGCWAMLGFGYWVVEEKDSRLFLGEVGFGEFKRSITPPIKGEPEIGWVLAPSVHGKGYATEAVRAALAWGDAHFGPVRMSCLIAPKNAASIRVAEKTGFVESVRTDYHGKPTIVLHRAPAARR